jgi:serine/threonine protein kinase
VTAKQDVAHEWNSAALTGEQARVVDLPYAELEEATQGFSEFNMVGGGASCAVFVARVFGVTAAIKQLKDATVEWEAKQFASEMAILQAVQHPNICRLLAFSHDGPHRCLVLELCSGGALNERLACKAVPGRAPPAPLTCQERVHIAHGIASALEYLHGLTPQMIHRDLKPPNVLLDDRGSGLVAKVADFGTVREGTRKGAGDTRGVVTHTLTSTRVGTNGYMPSEYASHGHVSDKLDMYSFGVVLVELLTSKGGLEVARLHCDEPDLFADMARYADRRVGQWPETTVTELAAIADQCVSFHARSRPHAHEVVPRLEALLG